MKSLNDFLSKRPRLEVVSRGKCKLLPHGFRSGSVGRITRMERVERLTKSSKTWTTMVPDVKRNAWHLMWWIVRAMWHHQLKMCRGLLPQLLGKFVEKWTYFFTHPHFSAAPTGLVSTAATT